jgi:predicted membrane chloride channel (bestrophin family)
MKINLKITNRHRLLLQVGVFVLLVICAKLVIHYMGWEVISINALFSGIIAANVFLMGFLLNGVLSDYKESERLPGELSACLENLFQEVSSIRMAKPEANAGPCLILIADLSSDILTWFHKKHHTAELMDHVNSLTPQFALLEQWTQATLVARLKQEQSNLRRTLTRIHTIRETSFISTGYLLADITTVLLCVGLILARIEPFYESLFFVGVISYLMIFLLMLIRDLDNPFGYYERQSGADVSLKPLADTVERLARVTNMEKEPSQPGEPHTIHPENMKNRPA